MSRSLRQFMLLLGLWLTSPVNTWACAVCYGEPDSPMSRGLTWAVVVLAGLISLVLVGIAGFFVYVSRRSREMAAAEISSGS